MAGAQSADNSPLQVSQLEVSQLEAALLHQAQTQAREQHQTAELAKARILQEATDRMKLAEAREILLAKADAERMVRFKVQATETRLATELDRLRWALTEAALSEVRQAFRQLVQDEHAYLDVLAVWLAAADRALPPGDVLVEVRAADQARLQKHMETLASQIQSGRKVAWGVHDKYSEGGFCVTLANHQARMDQTFEARQARMADDLARVVMSHLFAETSQGKLDN